MCGSRNRKYLFLLKIIKKIRQCRVSCPDCVKMLFLLSLLYRIYLELNNCTKQIKNNRASSHEEINKIYTKTIPVLYCQQQIETD